MSKEDAEMIYELSLRINEGNQKRGFWDDIKKYGRKEEVLNAFINQFLLLSVSEIGEACDALRIGKYSHPTAKKELDKLDPDSVEWITLFKSEIKDSFEDELADTVIRLLDLSGGLGIDIGWHIKNKLKYNESREAKHGKKF